ncbi:integrin beta-1-binding protein, putative [Ichthyophthirius multifiliis]|uniref:Integrin beta-1-binding protein, putative n=1 Tax=Ichthyophthirius multifiliis TaxID=5932 RepID=G0QIP7_ICHMU|nr:integrin beta-1-binding protein, putative [Ichthyophthirius multifiliis]EGR34877.1 integrin beta-1-binding protein, putative [Ichthyophthirius multifiliis]|eukprot:XP_004040181.1 integrin beta-1-binding protein, putative [Ichthyophthirius multifiliis]
MADQLKKCKRGGCNKKYTEQENLPNSCRFHPGKPIFHDTKKGWTCCNKIVYDWDEFQNIETCAEGMHTDVDSNQQTVGQDQFYKSSTVANAQKALDKEEKKIVIQKISDFNKQEDNKQKNNQQQTQQQQTQQQENEKKKKFITKNGNYKCTNKSCQKEYKEEDNIENACNYHSGEPVFHDLKKYWTCCQNKICYDWDEFMKVQPCTYGKHNPKYE